MRQLLVMSPHAFLGYEFSPAVAGRALPPLLLLSLHAFFLNTRKHLHYGVASTVAVFNEAALQSKPFVSTFC